MVYRILCVIVVVILIGSASSFAKNQCKVDNEEWNPVSAGPVTTWTAPLCGKCKFIIQPFFFYNRTRGAFDSDGKYHGLADGNRKYQYQEQLFMQYGLADRLEIDGQVIYQENYIKQDGVSAHAQGFGDSYLFSRYCVFEEKGWMPHLTGLAQLKIPTGKYQHTDPDKLGTDLMAATSGGGSWDLGFGFCLTKKLKPFIFHADAVYNFPQKVMVDSVKTIYGKYLNYDAGVECFLPKGFNLLLEVNGFLQGDKKENGERIPASDIRYLTIAPGIGWSNDKIQTLLVYQRTVTGTNIDANDSVVLTCVYAF